MSRDFETFSIKEPMRTPNRIVPDKPLMQIYGLGNTVDKTAVAVHKSASAGFRFFLNHGADLTGLSRIIVMCFRVLHLEKGLLSGRRKLRWLKNLFS